MSTRRHRRAALLATGALAGALVLAACGSDDPETNATETTITDEPTAEATDDIDGGNDDAETATVPSEYDGVLAAIALAEDHAGGSAFELDDGDDGIWEVNVAVGSDDIEVDVSNDGTQVLDSSRDGSVDSDDAASLEQSEISLEDAVRIAIIEYGGTAPIDDVDIASVRGGDYAWEVGFTDDVDVYVNLDGSILRVDND